MRRTKYIGDTYSSESCLDRFEFLYEHYGNFEEYMRCEKRCFLYMLESMMMYSFWEEYCKKYNTQNRKAVIRRISECIDRGEVIDFLVKEDKLPEKVLYCYRNYVAMRIDYRIFVNALESIGGKDAELLRRYIKEEVDLNGIAAERIISYETAKGKIRDLKKLLKEKTLYYMREAS